MTAKPTRAAETRKRAAPKKREEKPKPTKTTGKRKMEPHAKPKPGAHGPAVASALVESEATVAATAAARPASTDWKPTLEDPLIRQYILDHTGEYGLKLAEMIHKRQPITGVEIIDSIPEDKPSNIRKVLYKLEEARIAEYEKDTDKSGWETFTWRLSLNEVKYVINNQRKERLRSLKAQLDFEMSTQFYHCSNAHMRMPFDEAADQNFKCPHCGEAMDFVDNKDEIDRLKKEIRELEAITFDL